MNTAVAILVLCQNPECHNEFRFVERQKHNSTLKTKAPKFCQTCLNAKKMEALRQKPRVIRKPIQRAPIKRTSPLKRTSYRKTAVAPTNGKKRTYWYEKPTHALPLHVQRHFCNKYIRERDRAVFGTCISCTSGKIEEAGHRYSIGDFPELRLLVNNIHGQCHNCNGNLNGNGYEFKKGLNERHGTDYLTSLEAIFCQASTIKLLRNEIIEIGKTYQYLSHKRVWVFTDVEFNKTREILFK